MRIPAPTKADVNAARVAFVAELGRRLKLQPRATPPAPVKLFAFDEAAAEPSATSATSSPSERQEQRKPKARR